MPVITKIEQQKKRKDRYSVFVDDQYAFSLAEIDLVSANIRKGQDLSDPELRSLIELSGESKLYDKAIHYLSFRPRSVKEVRDHLTGKGSDAAEVEPVIQRLINQKFLDDSSFAHSWVDSRNLLKPSSTRRLVMELRNKGVSAEIIEQVLAEQDPDDELAAIQKVATKKLALAKFQDQKRLTDYLLRQGFGYDKVKAVLDDLIARSE